jgi:hypothetical protein
MKIAIGMTLRVAPFGGGNRFGWSLSDFLRKKGWKVFYDLSEPDLDLILLTDPRIHIKSCAFTDREIRTYLRNVNPKAVVVHRVNECDERKGTRDLNRRLMEANQCADHTVFISQWLQDLFMGHGLKSPGVSVVLNGADEMTFNPAGAAYWRTGEKIKIITHHWGGAWMKGFDIYERMDRLLEQQTHNSPFEFVYMGSLPPDFHFKHSRVVPPQDGQTLADTLKGAHIYLTGAQNEPAGMHHIEGAMCGLPLLYRESGALPEYCRGFGLGFNPDNFDEKLFEMLRTYPDWKKTMTQYPFTAERMCQSYERLFLELLEHKGDLIRRRPQRWPAWNFMKVLEKR